MKPHEEKHQLIIETVKTHLQDVLEDTCEVVETAPYETIAHHVNQVWFKTGKVHGREVSRKLFELVDGIEDHMFPDIDILIFIDGTYDKANLSFTEAQYVRVDFRTQKPHDTTE